MCVAKNDKSQDINRCREKVLGDNLIYIHNKTHSKVWIKSMASVWQSLLYETCNSLNNKKALFYHYSLSKTGRVSQWNKANGNENNTAQKGRNKLSLVVNHMISYVENPKTLTNKFLELIRHYSKAARYVNTYKS